MPWVDLKEEIAEMFDEVSLSWEQREELTRFEVEAYECERLQKRDYMRATAPRRNLSRQKARLARATQRPPCPHCGAQVERVGKSAKIPTYCSSKCMRAARFARWYAKHGAEHNERRRAA